MHKCADCERLRMERDEARDARRALGSSLVVALDARDAAVKRAERAESRLACAVTFDFPDDTWIERQEDGSWGLGGTTSPNEDLPSFDTCEAAFAALEAWRAK